MATRVRILAALAALVVVVGGVVVLTRGGAPTISVTAHFSESVGLYKGSSVRVLGVAVGKVTSITPEGRTVRVVMELPTSLQVPADAVAMIIPPSLVSDRYVQLAPAYSTGPTLADHADIPLSRTRTPVELDQILSSVDRLLVALGPNGVNKHGALSRAVSVGARVLKGNGEQVHTTLVNLSKAVETLANHRDDLVGVVTTLGDFSQTLADSDATVRRFTTDLGTAAEQLAAERVALGQALKELSISLGEVQSLVSQHKATLLSDVGNLRKVTDTLLAHERSLKEALDVLPQGVTNLRDAANTTHPGIESLDIRNDNDQTSDPQAIVLCQVLAPILKMPCPAVPGPSVRARPSALSPASQGTGSTPAAGGASTAPAAGVSGRPALPQAPALPDLGLLGLLGVNR